MPLKNQKNEEINYCTQAIGNTICLWRSQEVRLTSSPHWWRKQRREEMRRTGGGPPTGLSPGWGGVPVVTGAEVDVSSAASNLQPPHSGNKCVHHHGSKKRALFYLSQHLTEGCIIMVSFVSLHLSSEWWMVVVLASGDVSRMLNCLHPTAAGTIPRKPLWPWMQRKQW